MGSEHLSKVINFDNEWKETEKIERRRTGIETKSNREKWRMLKRGKNRAREEEPNR